MKTKKYKISYTTLFKKEFNGVLKYIRCELKNQIAAESFLNKVNIAILNRAKNPLSFQKIISFKERKHPYYKICVGNYIIYHVVIGDIMEVRRIIYGRRNFTKKLFKNLK